MPEVLLLKSEQGLVLDHNSAYENPNELKPVPSATHYLAIDVRFSQKVWLVL